MTVRERVAGLAAGSGRTKRWPIRRSATTDGAAVLGLYLLVAMVYIGRFALPSLAGGTLGTGPDVQIFLWGLRWWPYALAHGVDPFVSHVVWAPFGSNILWTTTVPAISLLIAPVTILLGPAVAWNVLCVLAPALGAWAAYLLCRELTGRLWPSAFGGALFGFSSFQLAEGLAHLQVAMDLCVPLAAWVIARHVHGRLSGKELALRLGAIAILEFLISPEILATMVLFGAILAAGAYFVRPCERVTLRRTVTAALGGLLGGVVVLSPLVVTMLRATPSYLLNTPATYSTDLVNFVVPTRVSALGAMWRSPVVDSFPGNLAEQGAYLGLPLLAIVVGFAVSGRRSPRGRLLLFMLLCSIVLSLGPRLTVAGHQSIWLPAALLARVPLLADALPGRFTLYTSLAAALIVGEWLTSAPSRLRTSVAPAIRRSTRAAFRPALAGLAALAIVPSANAILWWKPTPAPIAHGTLNRLLPVGSNVLSLPFWNLGDRSLYAQAASGMHFNLVDGWLQLMPAQYGRVASFTNHLSFGELSGLHGSAPVAEFKRGLCRLRIHYVIVWNYSPRLLAVLRLTPVRAGNALVYRLPPCPEPPGAPVPPTRS